MSELQHVEDIVFIYLLKSQLSEKKKKKEKKEAMLNGRLWKKGASSSLDNRKNLTPRQLFEKNMDGKFLTWKVFSPLILIEGSRSGSVICHQRR